MMGKIYGENVTNFGTLEDAKMYIIDHFLKKINSYDIEEEELSPNSIRWILNIYKGEVFLLDDKPTLMEYKVPHVAEFIFIKDTTTNEWIVNKKPSSIEEIASKFVSKYQSLMGYLEKVILEVSWVELLNIAQIENSVTPFYDIIRRIARIGRITEKDIKDLERKRNKSFEKYISLLIETKIIEHVNNKEYTFTNESLKIISELRSTKDVAHRVMAYFISQSAPQLIHNMHLYPLKSYVFLEKAYYIPVLQLNSMKKISMETYEKLYQKINKRRLSKGYIYSLYKLDEVGLMEVINDKYLRGVEAKYNEMYREYSNIYNYL